MTRVYRDGGEIGWGIIGLLAANGVVFTMLALRKEPLARPPSDLDLRD